MYKIHLNRKEGRKEGGEVSGAVWELSVALNKGWMRVMEYKERKDVLFFILPVIISVFLPCCNPPSPCPLFYLSLFHSHVSLFVFFLFYLMLSPSLSILPILLLFDTPSLRV